ncbi:MAG: DUF424 family protein [Desulfurococcaceae archaeon]|jgi:hypothetical protein|nr:DUF424 family protein [Desulfurococcaceae archaeon]MCC6052842.1 DUF424 family protein [Desulfurococcaceae archaeon]
MRNNDEQDLRVYIKIYNIGEETVVAACDEELLGALIVDSERNTRIYVDPAFYRGELTTIGEALEALKTSTQANLVGSNIVNAAIRAGLIDPSAVLSIGNVKIAIYIRF